MASGSYWHKFTESRLSRRRALAFTGAAGTGLAALGLIGCGSGSSGGSSQAGSAGGQSTLLSEPVDTTAQAKPGGVIKNYFTADILHFDALLSNSSSTVNDVAVFTYPRLLKFTTVPAGKINDGSMVEGDLMESFEVSPDKLTVTFKMRQGLKWDAKAPTSGRVIDTQDVLFSWKKFGNVNASAVNLVYDAQKAPIAAVESVTAPDDKTIVMKLRQPDGALLTLLAGWDQLYIMPRESDGGFDPKNEVRGYGPWLLEQYVPSSGATWRKNPDYYVKGRPFPDKLERPLVSDNAARLAQFRAGNILTDVVQNSQQDVVQLKKDLPQTLLRKAAVFGPTSSPNIIFGYEGNSIFKDVRVRQAMSMAIDRETFADVIENRQTFAKEGLEVEVAYNTVLSPGWPGFWMDPKDEKAFGPNAKYFQFNPAEAKKLLAAAGLANGAEYDFFHNQENTYGATYAKMVDIYSAMFAEVGLKARDQGKQYAEWLPQYHYGYLPNDFASGKVKGFNGIGLAAERTRYTPVISLFGLLDVNGDAFHGATTDGNNAVKGDAKLNADLDALRRETDHNKLVSGVQDVIRYATQQAYYIPKPSNPKFFTLWWPAIGNLQALNSSVVGANVWAEDRLAWWIDQSKPPFKS